MDDDECQLLKKKSIERAVEEVERKERKNKNIDKWSLVCENLMKMSAKKKKNEVVHNRIFKERCYTS
jgi:hypothetical protein